MSLSPTLRAEHRKGKSALRRQNLARRQLHEVLVETSRIERQWARLNGLSPARRGSPAEAVSGTPG